MNLGLEASSRTVHRWVETMVGDSITSSLEDVANSEGKKINPRIIEGVQQWAKSSRKPLEILQLVAVGETPVLVLCNSQKRILWKALNREESLPAAISELSSLRAGTFSVIPHGDVRPHLANASLPETVADLSSILPPEIFAPEASTPKGGSDSGHDYLDELETESIAIIREAVATAEKPAMLFSMGKDSMAMLTLARKAFAPSPVPFPLVVIDTRWKFKGMYRYRQWIEEQPDLTTIVYINPEAIERDVNPFDFGSATHTDITKTQALRKVLDEHGFDYVFGGARRDEEKSRSKERIFSVRTAQHGWDPKRQRPELWNLYNTGLVNGQTMRVFPLSNWTELDIWRYLERERVDLVPLYFSALRPYVVRNGSLIMVDDERIPLEEGEKVHLGYLRFRTLGCYPLTGGVLSQASSIADIIAELETTSVSERSSRVIDFDKGASMEQKKKDGYF